MLVRLARAYRLRPADFAGWDYWEEFVPAIENLIESPTIDEVASAFLHKKPRAESGTEPVNKEDRKAIFNKLKKARSDEQSKNQNNN